METNDKHGTPAAYIEHVDYLNHLDRLAESVVEASEHVLGEIPQGMDPFDVAATSMDSAVDRGASRQVRRLSALLDFALLVRKARAVDDPSTLVELVEAAEQIAARLSITSHPASASASGLACVY